MGAARALGLLGPAGHTTRGDYGPFIAQGARCAAVRGDSGDSLEGIVHVVVRSPPAGDRLPPAGGGLGELRLELQHSRRTVGVGSRA